MEYNSFLQKCNDDDVLELNGELVKLSKFRSASNSFFINCPNNETLIALARYINLPHLSPKNVYQLFSGDGVDANVLRIGSQGWKKGKLKFKVTLEFCPDEPEIEEVSQNNDARINCNSSPLDDIRQMMNEKR